MAAGASTVSASALSFATAAPGINPARKPTTAPTPSRRRDSVLPSSSPERSDSGVNIRVSLYPASRRRSSRRS